MLTDTEIDALLAEFAAAQTYAEYMPLRSRVVQALDSYIPGSGLSENRTRQWEEFERICRTLGPEIRKREYDKPVNLLDAVRASKLDRTLAAMQAEHDEGRIGDTSVTLDTVAALVCADIAASYAESIREDDVPAMAAE